MDDPPIGSILSRRPCDSGLLGAGLAYATNALLHSQAADPLSVSVWIQSTAFVAGQNRMSEQVQQTENRGPFSSLIGLGYPTLKVKRYSRPDKAVKAQDCPSHIYQQDPVTQKVLQTEHLALDKQSFSPGISGMQR